MSDQPTSPADAWKPDPREGNFSKASYLKVKDGETVDFRILSVEPRQVFMCRVPVNGKSYPATLSKDDSVVVKAHNEKLEESKRFKIKKVNAVNVLDRRDGTVKLWEFTETLKGDIHKMVERWKKLPTEFDISLSRTGSGQFDTRYTLTISPSQDPLTTEEKALETTDLNEYYKSNPERLATLLSGKLPERKTNTEAKKPETATVPPQQANPLEDGEEIV